MSSRPIIGVPTQTLQSIDGIPESLPNSWVMNQRYYRAITTLGGAPVMIPLLEGEEEAIRAIYDTLDGLFLAGGVDVDPHSYGEERTERCGNIDPPRDWTELLMVRWAMEDAKPVLGVCRGMQVINVARGGTLVQDIAAGIPEAIKHDYFPTQGYERDYRAHPVTIQPASRLHDIFRGTDLEVNSMHHQAIAGLGQGLAATAWAADGLIEGIEGMGDDYLVGAQWHPEMLTDSCPRTPALFNSFLNASREWRSGAAVLG